MERSEETNRRLENDCETVVCLEKWLTKTFGKTDKCRFLKTNNLPSVLLD